MSGLNLFLRYLFAILALILEIYALFKTFKEYKLHKEKNDAEVDRSILLIILRMTCIGLLIFILIILYPMIHDFLTKIR